MSNNGDILSEVLADEEVREAQLAALKAAALESPLSFYRAIVMPRLPKLKNRVSEEEFATMTPAEEAAFMDEMTCAMREEKEDAEYEKSISP